MVIHHVHCFKTMRELKLKEKQKMLEYIIQILKIFFSIHINWQRVIIPIDFHKNQYMLNKNGPKLHSYETVHA